MSIPIKILLVDDEQDLLNCHKVLLELDWASATCAHSYYEAHKFIENEHFDIVVTDYSMPKMHGIYLLDMIKDKRPDLPVIIVSAYVDDAMREKAMIKKADLVLKKGYTYSYLLECIMKILKKRK
jgi:DNA-binding NtrC family response regulator